MAATINMPWMYSRFNHTVQIPGSGDFVLVNFMTGKAVRLTEEEKRLFDSVDMKDRNSSEIIKYAACGFLTREDEMEHLRGKYFAEKNNGDVLKLTIAPTMACNFACDYCFEEACLGRMSEETQTALIAFVQKMLARYSSRKLLVAWYGGEPMLCMDIIEALTEKLRGVAEEVGVEYCARIVTNGWYFTQENAVRLENCFVQDAQITLDGTCKSHDRYRHLSGGGGTYNHILNNLRSVRTKIRITLRCNFHKDNLEDADYLIALVKDLRRTTRNAVFFEPARVILPSTEHKQGAEKDEVVEVDSKAYAYKVLNLVPQLQLPTAMGVPCATLRQASFSIDPKGYLYKCWEEVGIAAHSFGNVRSVDFPDSEKGARELAMYCDAPFPGDEEPCRSCKLLPICMGGCPNARRKQGIHRCFFAHEDVDAFVLKCCSSPL